MTEEERKATYRSAYDAFAKSPTSVLVAMMSARAIKAAFPRLCAGKRIADLEVMSEEFDVLADAAGNVLDARLPVR